MTAIEQAKQVLADEFKINKVVNKLHYEVKDSDLNLTYVIEVYAVTPEGVEISGDGGAGYPQGIGAGTNGSN